VHVQLSRAVSVAVPLLATPLAQSEVVQIFKEGISTKLPFDSEIPWGHFQPVFTQRQQLSPGHILGTGVPSSTYTLGVLECLSPSSELLFWLMLSC
jgi:hypothetical protein